MKWAALSIIAAIAVAGIVFITSVFNSPVGGAAYHWTRVENENMECVEHNDSRVLHITATINYSCSYKVDGKNELPLKVIIEIESYSNESRSSEKILTRKVFANISFHETYDIEENFSVPGGQYKGRITVLALKEGRWWGEWWALTGYRRVVVGPVTVEQESPSGKC